MNRLALVAAALAVMLLLARLPDVLAALNPFAPSRGELRARADHAEAAARGSAAALDATERVAARRARSDAIAAEADDEIQSATGAETPLPPDVRDAWRAGIDRLRDETGAGADPGVAAR